MNKPLFEKIIKAIENEPKKFDMDDYISYIDRDWETNINFYIFFNMC